MTRAAPFAQSIARRRALQAAVGIASDDVQTAGYAGDIAAAPGGGFVVSAQKAGRALGWQPRDVRALTRMAELTEVCAVASHDGGVLLASAPGLAFWHPARPARMLPWPRPMRPDNHAVVLASA